MNTSKSIELKLYYSETISTESRRDWVKNSKVLMINH